MHFMEYLRSACYVILVLSTLVLAHEWGHFIVAKLCGMRVDDFSLFFGPRLIRLGKRNGTEYNIRSVPLGGFVKIAGMEPEDFAAGSVLAAGGGNTTVKKAAAEAKRMHGLTDEALADVDADHVSARVADAVRDAIGDDARLTEEGKTELKALLATTGINADEHRYIEAILAAENAVPDPDGFNQKPLWKRAAVIAAGPLVSLAFGYVIFCVMGFTVGLPYKSTTFTTIETVTRDKPAYKAGVRPGDTIEQINGKTITDGSKMVDIIHHSIGQPLHIVISRDGKAMAFNITPEATVVDNQKVGIIGIRPKQRLVYKRYSPSQAVGKGTEILKDQVSGTIGMLFSGNIKEIRENSSSVIGIVGKIHDDSEQGGPRQVLLTAALISVGLCILNLLPIPILDGGHLLMLAVEGLRRRKLSSKETYAAQMVGLSIILTLFVLALWNDITRMMTH